MPPLVAELIEDPEPDAPYGVKGVGEPPTVVSTPAIVSAPADGPGACVGPRRWPCAGCGGGLCLGVRAPRTAVA
jgi:CO/xanthine dehydrogenase Mo-binding subunit